MGTTTVRIPEEKRDALKIIATIEKRDMKEILSELIDEYLSQHQETMDLLSRPEWVTLIQKGKSEIKNAVKGKNLNELDD